MDFGFGACALEFVEDTITQGARAGKRKSAVLLVLLFQFYILVQYILISVITVNR